MAVLVQGAHGLATVHGALAGAHAVFWSVSGDEQLVGVARGACECKAAHGACTAAHGVHTARQRHAVMVGWPPRASACAAHDGALVGAFAVVRGVSSSAQLAQLVC